MTMNTTTTAGAPELWAAEPSPVPGHVRVRAKIAGLHCSLCTGTIDKALSRLEGVGQVAVSLTHEQALVDYDPQIIAPERILGTLRDNLAWLVGVTGIALPALRQFADRLAADYDGDCHGLDAEMLTGFVQAIRVIDISTERIAARLCFAAYNAGRRLRHREAAYSGRRAEPTESVQPVKP